MSALRQFFNRPGKLKWVVLAGLATLLVSVLLAAKNREQQPAPPFTSYTQLERAIKNGKIEKLTWDPNQLVVHVRERDRKIPPFEIGVPFGNGVAKEGLGRLLAYARANNVTISSEPLEGGRTLLAWLFSLAPSIVIFALLVWALQNSGVSIFSRKRDQAEPTNVSFADVAGCGEAIEELGDVRAFLADPRRYERLGARIPKGVLLHGEPGTGKTLLAKAVATEAGIPFYAASGSEFVEMIAGLGARRVRSLFREAMKNAPSIVFIDELDAVGRHRSAGGDGGTREADQTVVALLKEMDGFDVSQHPVIVIGATNRLDSLDHALLRPGRFDRHIPIDPPDRAGRLAILQIHARGKPLSDDVDLVDMARSSANMTGASLALWLNEAALRAARAGADEITRHDIDEAYDRIIAGARKQNRALSENERRVVAFHESGHALVGERLDHSERVHKISIIPRGQSGGQTIRVSEEDVFLYSEQKLRDTLATLLAGRAAEELVFGQVSSGPANDLEQATKIARQMVSRLGMSDSVGLRVELAGEAQSEQANALVDGEVRQILAQEYDRARTLIAAEREILDRLSETLLVEETLDRESFLALIGPGAVKASN